MPHMNTWRDNNTWLDNLFFSFILVRLFSLFSNIQISHFYLPNPLTFSGTMSFFFLNLLSTFTCASFHPVFWFATSRSIILSSSFILTPNGLNLINRALYSLSHTLYTHTLTHKHSVLRSLLCRLNAESVIPWIKYKERWGSIRWLGTFKVIPRHCVF